MLTCRWLFEGNSARQFRLSSNSPFNSLSKSSVAEVTAGGGSPHVTWKGTLTEKKRNDKLASPWASHGVGPESVALTFIPAIVEECRRSATPPSSFAMK